MIIKKYLVSTIEEVEALISRDLGPNAVILTSRQIKYKGLKSLFFSNKIEVVAAVEDNEMQNYNEFSENANVSPELSSKTQSGISREWESPIQTLVEDEKDPQSLKSGLEESAEYEPSNIPGTYLDPRFNRKQAFENIPLKPAPPKEPPEIDHLKKLSEALKAHFKTIPLAGKNLEKETVTPKLKELDHDLVSYLISCGISHSNGTLILENLISRQGPGFFQARELGSFWW